MNSNMENQQSAQEIQQFSKPMEETSTWPKFPQFAKLSILQKDILIILTHEKKIISVSGDLYSKDASKSLKNTIYMALNGLERRGLIERVGRKVKLSGKGWVLCHGVPYVKQGTVPLDVVFSMDAKELRAINKIMNKLKTEFVRFIINEGVLSVEVGDYKHDFSNKRRYKPESEIYSGTSLNVIYGYGLSQISKSFKGTVWVFTQTNQIGIFMNLSEGCGVWIALPPYV